MPKKLFFQLADDKRKIIIDVAIAEFAAYGYSNASTNSIVKNSGISKGSLFKYFENKEDLYFFVLDSVIEELNEKISQNSEFLSLELFQRIVDYAALEFSWYAQNPEKSKLIISAFTKDNEGIYQKTVQRYNIMGSEIFYKLVDNIDLGSLRWEKKKTIDIIKWFLKGFNEEFLERVQSNNCPFENLYSDYYRHLSEYIEILKSGLLK